MPITVKKVVLWRAEVENKPGALASALQPPARAGVDLKGIMGYRHPSAKGAVIEVFPITGKKAAAAAGTAGLSPASIPTLMVEGDNSPGLGYTIAQAVADGGINIAFLMAQVIGVKFAAMIGFQTEEDATKAMPMIKRAAKGARA
jgi:hypothetical protein